MICVSMDEQYGVNYLINLNNINFAEIRMERMALAEDDIRKIFSQSVTFIATCRPVNIDDQKRREYLIAAIEAGARYVDIEIESDKAYREELIKKARVQDCKVIISFHDYEKTPSEEKLNSIVSLCFSEGADIVKVACKVNSAADCARLLGLLGREDRKGRLIVIGMGEKGKITRIVAPLLGSPFTFASAEESKKTAEGQIEKRLLERIMGFLKDA